MNKRIHKKKKSCINVRKKVKFGNFSVQRNLHNLRRIIPGCEQVDIETLFLKSIEQIVKLKLQVYVLRNLANYYGI